MGFGHREMGRWGTQRFGFQTSMANTGPILGVQRDSGHREVEFWVAGDRPQVEDMVWVLHGPLGCGRVRVFQGGRVQRSK